MPNAREFAAGIALMLTVLVAAEGITYAFASEAPTLPRGATPVAMDNPGVKAAAPSADNIRVVLPASWQPAGAQRDVGR